MPTTSRPNPRDLLFSFLVLRLGLLGEQQWIEQFRAWPAGGASFGDLLARRDLLSVGQRGAVEQLAASLLDDDTDSSRQLTRFGPPDHLLASLMDQPSCQSWLSHIFDTTKAIDAETTSYDESESGIDGQAETVSAVADTVRSGDDSRIARNLTASRRYDVLRTHAEGGLGRVSLAEDRELRRKVALKQIKGKFASTDSSRRRFVFEAEVTGQLEHPGIIPVYSLASDDHGNPFYTMRFVDGQTLGDAIKEHHRSHSQDSTERSSSPSSADSTNGETEAKFEFRQLLNRFVDLCNAMDYAHHRGFIHRDLKPSNVMLGRYGETLVVDWGLARRLDQRDESAASIDEDGEVDPGVTQPGAVVGTPSFMSPEQAAGCTDELTSSSDIYSLGSILYSILTGQRAYLASNVRKSWTMCARETFKHLAKSHDSPRDLSMRSA